jgi:SRSO17 transposase
MDPSGLDTATARRFEAYLDTIGATLRDKRQRASFATYAAGLLSDGARKSMEPMAARASTDPALTSAIHHRLIHFLGSAAWKDAPVRTAAARYAVDELERHGSISTWIIDDTGFLKQGKRSPGVQRQYTGSAGKRANCQIGVSLVLANERAEVPVDFKLYIPQSWADDRKRCRAAHIPDDVGGESKWELALDMIESAVETELPRGIVLADSAYGHNGGFRERLEELGLDFAVDLKSNASVRRVGSKGRLGKPTSVKALARRHVSKFKEATWREGTKGPVRGRVLRMRVVTAESQYRKQSKPMWLLIEWPERDENPMNYVISNLSEKMPLEEMLNICGNRWRIERSYQDLKGQLGLDHYEGRSFVGWHHHVSVALVCYAFLVAERARSFSPSGTITHAGRALKDAA